MQIRDRIKEFRRVKASELIANDRNPRRHPDYQSDAVAALLREVGYADALIARETPDGLRLIDGHLRQKLTPDQMVPVLVLDVSESEADKLLLALDPLTALAEYDREQLDSLLREVSTGEAALAEMLAGLARQNQLYSTETDKPEDLWDGMPEFEQSSAKAFKTLLVHFNSEDDFKRFCDQVGQQLTLKTKFIWFPEREREQAIAIRYSDAT